MWRSGLILTKTDAAGRSQNGGDAISSRRRSMAVATWVRFFFFFFFVFVIVLFGSTFSLTAGGVSSCRFAFVSLWVGGSPAATSSAALDGRLAKGPFLPTLPERPYLGAGTSL